MPEPRLPSLTRLQAALVAAFLLAVAAATGLADVRAARGNDPFGTLVVARAIALHGTVQLDALGAPHLDQRLGYRWFERNGHQYYVYPLGTPLIVSPVVAAVHAAGFDVVDPDTEVRVQQWLVVGIAIATAWLLQRLARRLLPFGPALACSVAFWAGTSMASVAGAALWSHTLAIALALMVLDHLVATEVTGTRVRAAWVGTLLFAAALTRPTMALFAVVVLGWLACRDWRRTVTAAVVLGIWSAGFLAFSRHEFGEWLPPYYRMGTDGGAFSTTALAGLLVSPSRGLFVFSPLLLAAWMAWPLARRDWPLHRGWWLVGLGWPVLLVAALTRWEMWWAGVSFGPRLLTDVLPGLFLLTLRTWPVRRPASLPHWSAVGLLAIAVGFSGWVHVRQGLFNPWVQHWNVEPSIDTDPWTRFDWAFPQFLHDGRRHRARLVAYFGRHLPSDDLPPVRLEAAVAADNPVFDAVGFDRMRDEGRWTLLQVAELRFVARPRQTPLTDVSVTFGTNGRQTVAIELNDTPLLAHTFETPMAMVTLPLPAGVVRDGVNRLRFVTPDARRMGRGDPKSYGVVVKGVMFR
ncbi:MAG TPA: hypothetical protein VMF13_19540 [Luteitalea sp.]|nr:hypothetical protein [Luteitalea sp.]